MLAKFYIEGVEFEADLSLHLPIPFSVLPTSLPQSHPTMVTPFSGKDFFPSRSSPPVTSSQAFAHPPPQSRTSCTPNHLALRVSGMFLPR